MTTTDPFSDESIAQPSTWTREHNHDVITRFAEKGALPHGRSRPAGVAVQVLCMELQTFSNEIVDLQNAAEMERERR